MPRDRSKPWGARPDDAETTEPRHPTTPGAWGDDDATGDHQVPKARNVRAGTRANVDETSVGGSLLPEGGDLGFGSVFQDALAPAWVDEGAPERTEPVAIPPDLGPRPAPPPAAPPAPARPAPAARTHPDDPDDLVLGPVEEFTISGVMPEELRAMAAAAQQAVEQERAMAPEPLARNVHADPPRASRHDPDPLITGVLAPADDEETLAMRIDEDPRMALLRDAQAAALRDAVNTSGPNGQREYHTFGAGLQRLDDLVAPGRPAAGDANLGGILELLDGSPPAAAPEPAAEPPAGESDRPRRIQSNRAGSLGRSASSTPPASAPAAAPPVPVSAPPPSAAPFSEPAASRAPTPSPARSRVAAPSSRGATPRPAPSRAELPRRAPPAPDGSFPPRGEGEARPATEPVRPARPRAQAPLPVDTLGASGRALDEEARIRAALASISEDEHTSWVKLDEPPGGSVPGHEPSPLPPQSPEPSLTMDLEQVLDEATAPVSEATRRNERPSIGEEPTIPAEPPMAPGDEPTMPVPVPPPPAARQEPPPAKPPEAKPAPKPAPPAAAKPKEEKGRKPPVELSPLGDEKVETYRDGVLPWIASAFAVMLLGSGLLLLLILLMYLI